MKLHNKKHIIAFYRESQKQGWGAEFGNPIPLQSLIAYIDWQLQKCRNNTLSKDSFGHYIHSLSEYHRYNAWSLSVFSQKEIIQRTRFQLKNIPIYYNFQSRPIVNYETLRAAALNVLARGCHHDDVVVLTIAITAFSSLARTYELLHPPHYEPMQWSCLYRTPSGAFRIRLPHPKVHKGYLQELQPISLPFPLNPTYWLSLLATHANSHYPWHLHNGQRLQTTDFLSLFSNLANIHPSKTDVSAFRAGGATFFLNHGYSIPTIQLMGRWDSDAFRRYIRTLPDAFLNVS
jgi:hypothetical protein